MSAFTFHIHYYFYSSLDLRKKKSLKVSLCLLVIPPAVITLYNCHSGASECLKCSGRKGLHTGPRKSWTSPAVSMEWVISNSNT